MILSEKGIPKGVAKATPFLCGKISESGRKKRTSLGIDRGDNHSDYIEIV